MHTKNSLFVELNSDYRKAIFLAGTGRSGTTWVSSIINYDNEYRDIFEPFHPYKVELVKHFKYRQYLRPDNQSREFVKPAELILSGRLRNEWTDQFNKKTFCQKRMIKDIRANFLLKWIHINFPEVPIIFLLRHPCAVVNSKLYLGWGNHLEELLAQPELVSDFLSPFIYEIKAAETDFEKQVFLWCLENYIPLKQFKKGEIHLAFYENFCIDSRKEIKALFEFIGKNFDESVLETLNKPSATTRKDSTINNTTANIIDGWKKHVTDAQFQRTSEILGLFGLDKIYPDGLLPDVDAAYALISK